MRTTDTPIPAQLTVVADPHPVTISLGLATYPHHAPGLADLVRAADDAVYAAKDAGRNRTMVATTTREPVPARR